MIDVLKTIWGIIFPFALGGAIAFVINVPMSFLEKMIFGKIKAGKKKNKKLARPVSLLLTMILAVGVVVLVMFGVIPHFTTYGTKNEKGSGLGLMLCKDFVELHGGKLWFESEGEGKGTTFLFSMKALNQEA